MIRAAFHTEIIIRAEKGKRLDEDNVAAVLKEWTRHLKAQVFESEGVEVKIIKIARAELSGKHERLNKDESIFRQVADPLVETQKIRK